MCQALLTISFGWCKKNALQCLGKNTFYNEIRMIDPTINYKKVPCGDGYAYGFEGLSLKSDNYIVERRM